MSSPAIWSSANPEPAVTLGVDSIRDMVQQSAFPPPPYGPPPKKSRITGGEVQINSSFTKQDAEKLAAEITG
jgi:hypothetical protein